MPVIVLRGLILLGTCAAALWVCSLILDDMSVTWVGIVTASLVFAVAFSLLTPLVGSLVKQYAEGANAFVGLIVVFLSLVVTNLISDEMDIDGALTWVLATVIVWLAVVVVRFLLGAVFKDRLARG